MCSRLIELSVNSSRKFFLTPFKSNGPYVVSLTTVCSFPNQTMSPNHQVVADKIV
jgi:hypothetical protein